MNVPVESAGGAPPVGSPVGPAVPARPFWSSRYATATLIAILLALVPTIVNTYLGRRVVEGPPLADALPPSLLGRFAEPTTRRAATIQREFASDDWAERAYGSFAEGSVAVLAVRSYDMKRLYHHPELALSNHEYEASRVVSVASSAGPLDVHVLPGMNGTGVAAYALVYEGTTVANPFVFQVRVAPRLLLTGQRPLLLVFAEDTGAPADSELATSVPVRAVAETVTALMAARER